MPVSQIQNASLASGVPSAAKLPAGSVIQVVQQTTVSTATTSSAIAVTTGFSASITPTSSSSKILILLSACMDSAVSNGQPNLTIYRNNTTNLANTGGNQMSLSTTYGASSRLITNNAISYLDSPATTSSTTYTAYFFNTGSAGTMTFNAPNANNTNTATITLMEIAA